MQIRRPHPLLALINGILSLFEIQRIHQIYCLFFFISYLYDISRIHYFSVEYYFFILLTSGRTILDTDVDMMATRTCFGLKVRTLHIGCVGVLWMKQ